MIVLRRVVYKSVSPAGVRGTERWIAAPIGQALQAFKLDVAAPAHTPLVVVLLKQGTDLLCDGGVVGEEDAHDVRSVFDLGIEPVQGIGAVLEVQLSEHRQATH
jgi:hypothetical protein